MAGKIKKCKGWLGILLLLVMTSSAGAQWSFSFGTEQEYNDNPFRLPVPRESWIYTADFKIGRDIGKLSLSYYGSYIYFDQFSDRNFYWHQISLWQGTDQFSWGVNVDQRINRSDYNIYDYTTGNAFFYRQWSSNGLFLKAFGSLDLNQYPQFNDMNNWQVNSQFQLIKGFETKTTLLAGVGLFYKRYLSTVQDEVLVADQEEYMMGEVSLYGRGRGRGRFGYPTPMVVNEVQPSISQGQIWLRVAQSVMSKTGLALQYRRKFLLSGMDRSIAGLAYEFSQESELFDDPMAYTSQMIGAEITRLLPAGFSAKIGAYATSKNYISQGVYLDEQNYSEDILREDRKKTFWLRLNKQFQLFGEEGLWARFTLNYQWLINESNSYWYDYENQYVSVGLQFER